MPRRFRAVGHDCGRRRGDGVLEKLGWRAFTVAVDARGLQVIEFGSTQPCDPFQGPSVARGECADRRPKFSPPVRWDALAVRNHSSLSMS